MYKRILLGILFSPFLVPVAIIFIVIWGFICGIEYVLTGKYNQDDGGW